MAQGSTDPDTATQANTVADMTLTPNMTSTPSMTFSTIPPAVSISDQFHTADYVVFILSLVLTAAIGLGFALWGLCRRGHSNTEEYMLASRSMSAIPVSLSLLGSLFNAVFILGGPADVYYFGLEGMWIAVCFVFIAPVTAHLVIPTFYKMRLTSAYEYLEKRFSYLVRVLGSIVYGISLILFLAIVLYSPALAFSHVSGLSLGVSIGVTGGICAVYTALGGMKAVIWTDTIQMIILFVGMVVLAAKGTEDQGGITQVWQISKIGGRVNWADKATDILDPHPHHRHTFWGQVVGQWFVYIGILISNQMMIQRYLTVTNLRQAQISIYLMVLFSWVTIVLLGVIGVAMYARYAVCDPLIKGRIKQGEQIVALFLMDTLGQYHGLPGLFAAALSSVSSAVNSLACICLEDYIKPIMKLAKRKPLSDCTALIISMVLALFFGGVTIGLSFVAPEMTKSLIESIPTIWSLVGGPLAGVFILGLLVPFSNTWGAVSGLLVSLALGFWLGVGAIIHSDIGTPLSLGFFCLTMEEIALLLNFQAPTKKPASEALMKFYQISYAWYGVFTMFICIITGIIVSLLTGCSTPLLLKEKALDPSLACRCVCIGDTASSQNDDDLQVDIQLQQKDNSNINNGYVPDEHKPSSDMQMASKF